MGALHEGHQSLMKLARKDCDHLVVSIFVNPTQFAPNEDLDIYPRDRAGDLAKCDEVGVDFVFFPDVDSMYPEGDSDQPTVVDVRGLTQYLCGASRPTHFRGVSTVVTKLFNIVRPDLAVFGQKDYQQLAVIRQMTRDLNFDIDIVGGPTHREDDGLALSSRNRNIPRGTRGSALALSRGLGLAWAAFRDGTRDPEVLEAIARERIASSQEARVDYVECVHPDNLVPLREVGLIGEEGAVLACAAYLGPVRLIDNIRLDEPLPPAIELES